MKAWGVRLAATRWAGLPAADVVLAGVLMVVAVASAAAALPPEGPRWVTVPVAVVMTGALAWRTRSPLAAVLVAVGASEVQALVAESPGSLWSLAVLLVAAYSVAVACPEGRAAVGGAVLVVALWSQEWLDHQTDYLFVVLVFGGAWLLGRLVRQWRERAATAELNQEQTARLAVAEERARIARELHDLVAHAVSVISVQADAASAVLDVDPARAREPLRAIGDSARDVLDELRRLLVLLRADDAPSGPQPSLAELPELVRGVREAGLPVELRVHGEPGALAAGVELTGYRIVQEALTNVVKHARRAATEVEVRYEPDAVALAVVNAPPDRMGSAASGVRPGRGARPGHGLVGMRERVALVGGELMVGSAPDGGFAVRAHLPRHAPLRERA